MKKLKLQRRKSLPSGPTACAGRTRALSPNAICTPEPGLPFPYSRSYFWWLGMFYYFCWLLEIIPELVSLVQISLGLQIFPSCLLGITTWTTPDNFKLSLSQTDYISFSPKYVPLLLFPNIRTWLHCQFTCPKTEAWQPLGFSPVSTCKPSPDLFCLIVSSALFFSSTPPLVPATISHLRDCNNLLTGHWVLPPTSALLNMGSFQ